MFLILVAYNAMEGTLLNYKPPTFVEWERGVWERGTWGMNDEFSSTPAPSGGVAKTTGFFRTRRLR